jgi:MFS family permease
VVPALSREAMSELIDRRLINRSFARLWYGQAVSSVGDYVFNTTLTLWIAVKLGAGKPWAPAAMGGLLIAATIAVVVVGPIAGVWVDRWDRRRTMLRTESVRALLAGALALVSLLPERELPVGVWLALIYVLVFALNAAGRFFGPAQMVTISRVVPGVEAQTRAFGIVNATGAVTRMIGPPLAVPLLFAGLTYMLYARQTTFAAGIALLVLFEIPVAVVGTSMDPIMLASIPQQLFARVMSTFGTLNQGTNMLSMAVWATLASTALRGFHSDVLGVHVGPIDSILTLAGLAIFLGGVVSKITLPSSALLDQSSTAKTSVEV